LVLLVVLASGCAHAPVESQPSAAGPPETGSHGPRAVIAPGATPGDTSQFIKWDAESGRAPAATAAAGSGYGLRAANVDYLAPAGASPLGLPSNAKPGDCYV
jgi:hypothetical protein